ncbi:hypothetical protein CPLU01_14965 [Colletotrichum plurivorum]|uniref:Uncharacterized protein n=1 Tax=Colletotrichum plurivorum TaxID=2175906 RepID=A0A8H6MXR5_9PEZI|nr:hypothetical protein CPLU01_14965 [Colletotrichum plurivorum]
MPEAPQARPSPGETRDSSIKRDYNEDAAHRSLLDGSDAPAASESYRDKRRTERAAIWRPTWLQPSVLWAFATLFLLCSASFPTMLWYSLKHDGLVPTRQSLVYLWRFGPTGVASLLLKLQIILAPGLYSLAKTHIAQPVGVRVLDSFHPIERDVRQGGTSAYYLAQALHSYDMQYPFGLTENEAYQTFRNENGTTFRGTPAAPLDVVVDAYIPDMQCLKLEGHPFSNITMQGRMQTWYSIYYEIHLQFEGCNQTIVASRYISTQDDIPEDQEQIVNGWQSNVSLSPRRPCDNLPQESNQTLYYVVSFEKAPGVDPSHRTIRDVAAILCSSSSWISKVRIVDDGVKPVVTRVPGEPRRLLSTDLWNTLSNAMPLFVGDWNEGVTQRAWGPVNAEHAILGKTASVDDGGISEIPSTYTTNDLYESTIKMSRIIGTAIGHSRHRQMGRLATVSDEGYIHLLWTSIPTLVVLSIAFLHRETFRTIIWAAEWITCPDGTRRHLNSRLDSESYTSVDRVYVAGRILSPGNMADINHACALGFDMLTDFNYTTSRSQTYAWGEYSTVKEDLAHFTMWRCNYTWTAVPTDITLVVSDGKYVLDPETPPQPDMSRAVPWNPPLDVPQITNDEGNGANGAFPQVRLINPLMGDDLSDQFRVLAQPFGPFEPEEFGDPNREIDMIMSLQHNYAFLAAQLANAELRLNASESSRTSPAPGGLPAIDAVMTNLGRRRLIQNPTVTYVIVVILVLVVLANVWLLLSAASRRLVGKTWVLNPEVKGLAPDEFNSIAAMAALLRDSNVPNYLPESPELLSRKEFYGRLSDLTFRMGWFENQQEKAKYFTVEATGDDDFKFIGSRKDVSRAGVSE